MFFLRFQLSEASSNGANGYLRVPKACLAWFSNFIDPGESQSSLKGFHLVCFSFICVVFGFVVVRIRNLAVVPTLQWGGNRNTTDTAMSSVEIIPDSSSKVIVVQVSTFDCDVSCRIADFGKSDIWLWFLLAGVEPWRASNRLQCFTGTGANQSPFKVHPCATVRSVCRPPFHSVQISLDSCRVLKLSTYLFDTAFEALCFQRNHTHC